MCNAYPVGVLLKWQFSDYKNQVLSLVAPPHEEVWVSETPHEYFTQNVKMTWPSVPRYLNASRFKSDKQNWTKL